jgi:hypothetical protein
MQTVTRQPPRAGPGMARPAPQRRASFSTWLAFVQRKLQQTGLRRKRCLASFSGGMQPGPACAYTMLVASDIKKDAYGVEL